MNRIDLYAVSFSAIMGTEVKVSASSQSSEAVLREAEQNILAFFKSRTTRGDIENAGVSVLRRLIRYLRMVIERNPKQLSWKANKKPDYWSDNLVPFCDVNNKKKSKDHVVKVVKFLLCELQKMKRLPLEAELLISSIVSSDANEESEDFEDWHKEKVLRIQRRVRALKLDKQLEDDLLNIVDIWLTRKENLVDVLHQLECLIDQLKYIRSREREKAIAIETELRCFADRHGTVLNPRASGCAEKSKFLQEKEEENEDEDISSELCTCAQEQHVNDGSKPCFDDTAWIGIQESSESDSCCEDSPPQFLLTEDRSSTVNDSLEFNADSLEISLALFDECSLDFRKEREEDEEN